ncbi:MAG: hypothetical protein M1833_000646 [Piccolia ochrophora]|nr:MAG: hypothetical protein M1833_000646 [Piccolia ochrophora]
MNPPPPPPPPPPPHGASAKSSGLPPGNYDIFVIPPHSAGSGFLYLPSLHTQRNSFLAGVACALMGVMVWQICMPVLREWFTQMMSSGGSGMLMMVLGVGIAGWAWGKTQTEGFGPGPGGGSQGGAANAQGHGSTSGSGGPGATPNAGPGTGFMPGGAAGAKPKPTWQRANTGPAGTNNASAGSPQTGWEKARDETRRKEEERKAKEEADKKSKESSWEKAKEREKEARERGEREKKLKEAREKDERERKAREARDGRGANSAPNSPRKHQQPTARTYLGTDDDEYSFRPYDKPKRPLHKEKSHSSIYSQSSYAPSQSTSRTTPPPSHRGPYTTKDPDKIVIKAVYSFMNSFAKIPTSQLVSGVGSVTDGLILRITTEGLFIDDDLRGVPQREWDVKAWTMKLVEVWCPQFWACRASSGSSAPSNQRPSMRRLFMDGKASAPPTQAESELICETLFRLCKASCSFGQENRPNATSHSQSGTSKGLHVLRASVRDQDGRRYVFVLEEAEGWKVAVGLQRLRRGTQVRALGVSGLSAQDSRLLLEGLGWGGQ